MQDFATALRYLRAAQALLRDSEASPEVTFQTHFLTFFILWKVKKYRKAWEYGQMCAKGIGELVLSERSKLTIAGLMAMATAACSVALGGHLDAAKAILCTTLSKLQPFDLNVKRIMENLYWRLDHYSAETEDTDSDFEIPVDVPAPEPLLPGLPTIYLEGQKATESDLLVDSTFENLFFISTFLSAIRSLHTDPSTPLISTQDLEAARLHRKSTFLHLVPELPLNRINIARPASVSERLERMQDTGSGTRRDYCQSRRVEKRSPSLGAQQLLANGRSKLQKLSANLRKLRVEAVKRRKVKSTMMLQFDPISTTEVCYTPS